MGLSGHAWMRLLRRAAAQAPPCRRRERQARSHPPLAGLASDQPRAVPQPAGQWRRGRLAAAARLAAAESRAESRRRRAVLQQAPAAHSMPQLADCASGRAQPRMQHGRGAMRAAQRAQVAAQARAAAQTATRTRAGQLLLRRLLWPAGS